MCLVSYIKYGNFRRTQPIGDRSKVAVRRQGFCCFRSVAIYLPKSRDSPPSNMFAAVVSVALVSLLYTKCPLY